MAHLWRGLLNEYRDRLPLEDNDPIVTLGEGGTPLVYSRDLSNRVNAEVYIKVEGANPTGSFKDRGMTMAVSKIAATDTQIIAAASTGNTSASAAAYAVAAGLRSVVVLPAGKIAAGKIAQAVMHGAELIQIDGNFDDSLRIVRALTEQYPVALVNSVNPYRLQGQKTASFEIVDALGDAPDIHVLPVGNAGNISAYWMGYNEYAGRAVATTMEESYSRLDAPATKVPQMWGVQAAGSAPFIAGHPIDNPETLATAIRIGAPASWDYAVAARDDSHGHIRAVSDEAILEAQQILAGATGIFVEPASAASVAGLLAASSEGLVPEGAKIVATVTGNGLKDTATALAGLPGGGVVEAEVLPAQVDEVARKLGL